MIPASPSSTTIFTKPWPIGAESASGPEESLRRQFLFCLAATFIDGLGTIIHLGRGAHEANPIWAGLIDAIGVMPAMGLRVAVGIALLSLLFSLWRKPLARLGMGIMVAAFAPLTLYHLFLLVYLPIIT